MRAVARRLLKLETKLVPAVDSPATRSVALLRERRRRQLAAEGREADEQLLENYVDLGTWPRSIVEALTRARAQRRAQTSSS